MLGVPKGVEQGTGLMGTFIEMIPQLGPKLGKSDRLGVALRSALALLPLLELPNPTVRRVMKALASGKRGEMANYPTAFNHERFRIFAGRVMPKTSYRQLPGLHPGTNEESS